MDKTYIIVVMTTADKKEAKKIVRHLLDVKLIACANLVTPISSYFQWSGKIEAAKEILVLMKSREDLFEKLVETVKALHSYEVPEILGLPIVRGSKTYMDWLDSSLQRAHNPDK